MRLTAAEYARGLLSWHAVPGLSIRVGTAPDATTPKTWSPPLASPDGSVIPLELQDKIQFEFGLKAPAGVIELATFWIRLERVQKGVVLTRYFHGLPEAAIVLKHLPDYGTYHRLVVDANAMSWDEDLVFRDLGILVRFVNGEVEGEAMSDLTPGVSETGDPVLQGEQKTERVSGRFIEIVTPGKSAAQAEEHAFAVLGLLAVALGRNVIGRVVFTEAWQADPSGQSGIATARGGPFARHAEAIEFDLVDVLLSKLTTGDPMARARALALRWYERGLRVSAPLDQLLSFFIGVEALVQAYAKNEGPLPVVIARKADDDQILKAVGPLGKKVVARVAQRIRGASIREQFTFFATEYELGSAETSRFDKSKALRDAAAHGDAVDVNVETANESEHLLRSMLKAAFAVTVELPWEAHPAVHELKIGFQLGPAEQPPPAEPTDAKPTSP